MSSWFTSIADSVAKSITDTATNVGSHINDNANLKQAGDIFNALTLNTPEMTAEREDFRKDELRKTAVKDALSKLLPWDTQYEERQILVDECHEAILSLSKMDSTFLGHDYSRRQHQPQPSKNDDNDNTNSITDESSDIGPDSAYSDGNPKFIGESNSTYVALCRAIATTKGKGTRTPPSDPTSSVSASGMPPLLEHFDLDAHVGLVEVMLKEDPRLVEQHAKLCNIWVSEDNFWKNYFYNVALVRLDVGLNIDEIWGAELPTTDEEMTAAIEAAKAKAKQQQQQAAAKAAANVASRAGNVGASIFTSLVGGGAVADNADEHGHQQQESEEEITFDSGDRSESAEQSRPAAPLTSGAGPAASATPQTGKKSGSFSLPPLLSSSTHKKQADNTSTTATPTGKSVSSASISSTPAGADFEMVSPPKMGGDDNNNNSGDDLLDDDNVVVDGIGGDDDDDDLDAEIARELEGL